MCVGGGGMTQKWGMLDWEEVGAGQSCPQPQEWAGKAKVAPPSAEGPAAAEQHASELCFDAMAGNGSVLYLAPFLKHRVTLTCFGSSMQYLVPMLSRKRIPPLPGGGVYKEWEGSYGCTMLQALQQL